MIFLPTKTNINQVDNGPTSRLVIDEGGAGEG